MALFDLYSFSFLPQYIEIAGRNRVSGKTEKALAILGVFYLQNNSSILNNFCINRKSLDGCLRHIKLQIVTIVVHGI